MARRRAHPFHNSVVDSKAGCRSASATSGKTRRGKRKLNPRDDTFDESGRSASLHLQKGDDLWNSGFEFRITLFSITPPWRVGRPEEIASSALFLALAPKNPSRNRTSLERWSEPTHSETMRY